MENFPDVKLFLEEKAIIQLKQIENLSEYVEDLLKNPEKAHEIGNKASHIVQRSKGSTIKNIEIFKNFINESSKEFLL